MSDALATAFEMVLGHLDRRAVEGETHVWVSKEARAVLREWHLERKEGAVPRVVASAGRTPVASSAPPAGPVERLFAAPASRERAAALAGVREAVVGCAGYAALRTAGSLRGTMVFAVGNPASPLVFVGEAPGAEEERLGEPFVGPAGQLLTRIISAMGLDRGQVYITNIVKYRPSTGDDQGNRNRKPTSDEIAVALPHLLRELEIIQPKVIVALGATALEGLMGEPVSITKARGKFLDLRGIPLMPTFHPSYLLRDDSLTERRKVWEDCLLVLEKLGMPISDKQRAFFKV